jgi:hypothetical protein
MWNHEDELMRFLKLGFTEEENQKIFSGNFKEFVGLK